MSRKEFGKQTRRDALDRSNGFCEASGRMYGLELSHRCNAHLSHGVEFDHIMAASNGGDNSLSNCLAVCKMCHSYKTRHFDTPRAAKIVRQQDKHKGVNPKRPWSKFRKKMNGEVIPRD